MCLLGICPCYRSVLFTIDLQPFLQAISQYWIVKIFLREAFVKLSVLVSYEILFIRVLYHTYCLPCLVQTFVCHVEGPVGGQSLRHYLFKLRSLICQLLCFLSSIFQKYLIVSEYLFEYYLLQVIFKLKKYLLKLDVALNLLLHCIVFVLCHKCV